MPSRTAAIWAGAVGAAVIVAGGAMIYATQPSFFWPADAPTAASVEAPGPAADSSATAVAPPPGPGAPASTARVKPAFDVVNIEPTGDAVIAGSATPNARVELRDAGKTVAEATADSAGQFVIIPPPLMPGDHSLTLATGESAAETSSTVPVAVPEPPSKAAAAATNPATGPVPVTPAPGKIVIHSIEASTGGKMVAMGLAEPNATVRLYLSGAFVGDAKTKADGRWSLTIRHGLTAGAYDVRADEINPADATVIARAETPFDFPAADASNAAVARVVASADDKAPAEVASDANVVLDFIQTHHVEKGHTLWGISQKVYGDGSRYELIFAANANQIKNPNLIYPGQTFVVPRPVPKP